jgi:hypothetical protein
MNIYICPLFMFIVYLSWFVCLLFISNMYTNGCACKYMDEKIITNSGAILGQLPATHHHASDVTVRS